MNSGLNRSFYRETVQDFGVGEGRVIRQRGGIGVYAHVRVDVRALKRGDGIVFAWNAGLNIPANFASAVSQGVHDSLRAGVLRGLELTDIYASVESGSYHDEDSTADAFREAAENATTEAILQARPMILEAMSMVTVTVPAEFLNAVEAAVTSRDAQVMPSVISAKVVQANLPTLLVDGLIEKLLRVSEGRAKISSAATGFRAKREPPDTDQWVSYT
jgi:elongation factor G